MVTVRESTKIINDNTRTVAAQSAIGRFNLEWLITKSANIKPGMPVKRWQPSAAVYDDEEIIESAADEEVDYGIAELDTKQIADCSVAYASGDLIPVIPFHSNPGLVCRNIILLDPSSAMRPDEPLDAGNAGLQKAALDHRVYMRMKYDIAAPGEDTRVVAYIAQGMGG